MNTPVSMVEPVPEVFKQLEPFLLLAVGPACVESLLGLPVCRECQAALLPKSLMDHLRKQHKLPVELRGAVRSLTEILPSLDFDDVPNNTDGSAPVEALRVVDAFRKSVRDKPLLTSISVYSPDNFPREMSWG